jgi:CHASE1-domain containing sensor protein
VRLRAADILVNLLVLAGLGLIVAGLAVLVVAAIVAAPVRRRT